MSGVLRRTGGGDPTNGAIGRNERRTFRAARGINLAQAPRIFSTAAPEETVMARTVTPTPVRAGSAEHSPPVEDLIKKLVREGLTPSSEVVVARPVTIAEEESGGDPYNRTGRFRKLFK
jgi:hypothetical protein